MYNNDWAVGIVVLVSVLIVWGKFVWRDEYAVVPNEVLDKVTVLVEIDALSDVIIVLVIEFVVDCCVFDEVLITVEVDVSDVAELGILVYDDVFKPSIGVASAKIKKKLTIEYS